MSLKCHFDADGWLQGPISITPPPPCTCPPCWGGLTPPPACPAHGQTEMYQVRC